MSELNRAGLVSESELESIFRRKYLVKQPLGWSPRIRWRYRYYNPDDVYEAIIERLVKPDTRWLDVGAGRKLFPANEPLSRELAERCALLVGVDPDVTIRDNPFVHSSIQASIEELDTPQRFDLATMRMVAEHIREPRRVIARLSKVLDPGGRLVIYTVNRWSPVPLFSSVVPESWQSPIKRLFWDADAKDTFPVVYKMNTRESLRGLMREAGFDEEGFAFLDDCRALAQFRIGLYAELTLWKCLRAFSIRYPENCLLGIYVKQT